MGLPSDFNPVAAAACNWDSTCYGTQPNRWAAGPGYDPAPGSIANPCTDFGNNCIATLRQGVEIGLIVGTLLGNIQALSGLTGMLAEDQQSLTKRYYNALGQRYPQVIDPRTGQEIPAPNDGLGTVPKVDRIAWTKQERYAFIKEWHDRGYATPSGGWAAYDIHHILPREYGGGNDFDNLVPVLRSVHQQQFNSWWQNYG